MSRQKVHPTQITRRCDGCDQLFQPEMRDVMVGFGRFCSRKCINEFRRHPAKRALFSTFTCALCLTKFSRDNSSIVSKSGLQFCSRTCKDIAQRLESNFPQIRPCHYSTGEVSYRQIAFRHYPKICNRCGYDKYENVLQVHHIDRNRQNNNHINLEILCPTCHLEEHFLAGDGLYSGKKLVDKAGNDPAPEVCRTPMLPITPLAHVTLPISCDPSNPVTNPLGRG